MCHMNIYGDLNVSMGKEKQKTNRQTRQKGLTRFSGGHHGKTDGHGFQWLPLQPGHDIDEQKDLQMLQILYFFIYI